MMKNSILYLSVLIQFCTCRDFYLGAFKKNDLLMSQDSLYQEKVPFRYTYAKYGRTYKCRITYVRVIDRLNIGRGPRVQIIRGGLRKKYIVLRLTSPYNNPISVNIFVGCDGAKYTNPPWKIIRPTKSTTQIQHVSPSVEVTVPTTEGTSSSLVPSANITTLVPGAIIETDATTLDPSTVVTDATTLDPSTVVTDATTLDPSAVVTDATTLDPSAVVTDATTLDPSAVVTDATTLDPSAVVTNATTLDPSAVVTVATTLDPSAVVTNATTLDPSAVVTVATTLDPSAVVTNATTLN